MSRGPKRRTIVFVDYSAMRDSFKDLMFPGHHHLPPENINFENMGRVLCSDDQEFIRINLYSGVPVELEWRDNSPFLNGIAAHPHEVFSAQRAMQTFDSLQQHINKSSFTKLHCGRMVSKRVQIKHGPAFQWAQDILAATSPNSMDDETKAFFDQAKELNSQAKAARIELSMRIMEIKEKKEIPSYLMGKYSHMMSNLLDERISFSEKGVDTLLTTDALEHCRNDAFDDAIIFSADEDFIPMVMAIQKTGRRVVHAFWNIRYNGFHLQTACDQSVLLGHEDISSFVSL